MGNNPNVISFEEFQKYSRLENLTSQAIRVKHPNGREIVWLKLLFRSRAQLQQSNQGSELTTRENLVCDLEYAKVAVRQMQHAISLAERFQSRS